MSKDKTKSYKENGTAYLKNSSESWKPSKECLQNSQEKTSFAHTGSQKNNTATHTWEATKGQQNKLITREGHKDATKEIPEAQA